MVHANLEPDEAYPASQILQEGLTRGSMPRPIHEALGNSFDSLTQITGDGPQKLLIRSLMQAISRSRPQSLGSIGAGALTHSERTRLLAFIELGPKLSALEC